MKKILFGAFAAVCAAFSLAAVNINTASSAELEALPGIGPAKAKSIVEYRQKNGAFKSVEELKNVKGIGDAVLNKLKAEATVSSAAPKGRPACREKISRTLPICRPAAEPFAGWATGRLCLGVAMRAWTTGGFILGKGING